MHEDEPCYVCYEPIPEQDDTVVKCDTCQRMVHGLCFIKMYQASLSQPESDLNGGIKCGFCRTLMIPSIKSFFESEVIPAVSGVLRVLFFWHLRLYLLEFDILMKLHTALGTMRSLLRPTAKSYYQRLHVIEGRQHACDSMMARLGISNAAEIQWMKDKIQALEIGMI